MGRQQIAVRDEVIRLGQFLKLAGVVDTGGEAKLRIQEGEARVNGEVETRRGRQLVAGDLVEFGGEVLEVVAKAGDQISAKPSS
ncbi:MAG: RNA-binding S4 domain-containing protein [Desulfurivibrionaceae bacterium]|jgi:ribosome-associated protein|nr:RNA-binding S4 domain-containing protein [Desulfobulbaceae bacterium]MDP2001799.1 RNA-binding S4 domain-containing protein [Desulfurivibrionaceae bacterium]MDP2758477.1 RNA-binding S4 domain-containing protein [Desulfurivibrionaceae bacterium]PKN22952.1 MAG: RNA-binding protein [Deltaproteobacteria bacterium HGW-Deltaproteobacteria-3]